VFGLYQGVVTQVSSRIVRDSSGKETGQRLPQTTISFGRGSEVTLEQNGLAEFQPVLVCGDLVKFNGKDGKSGGSFFPEPPRILPLPAGVTLSTVAEKVMMEVAAMSLPGDRK
jgi:hypothetical protein